MSRNPRITIAGMSAELGISGTAVKKHLHALKESGKIQRMGSDREGRWKVIK